MNLRYHLWHGRDFSAATVAITRARPGSREDKLSGWVPGYRSGPFYLFDVIRPIEEQVDWLEKKEAAYLLTYPSNLGELLKFTGKKPRGLIQVATMGEVLDPEVRAACRQIWGVDIVDAYSAEEVGMIAPAMSRPRALPSASREHACRGIE